MASRDVRHNVFPGVSLAPDAYAAASTGQAVDLQGFEGAGVTYIIKSISGSGSPTSLIEESDDGTTWNAVAVSDLSPLSGSAANPVALSTGVTQVDYIGQKRYIRASLALGGATGVSGAALVIRTVPRHV